MRRLICRLNLPWVGGHLWSDDETDVPVCVRCKRRLW